MTTTVKLPDGQTITVQTDDPQQAAKAAQAYWVQQGGELPPPPPGPQRRTALQTVGDFIGDTVDNGIPNWADELAGGIDAAGALLTGKPVGEAFRQGQQDFKDHQAQYDREHPNLAWASTIGGTLAGLALPGGAVTRGASLGSKAFQGAKIGAAYGALSGAGEGETLSDRGDNALRSGLAGMAFGGAAAPVVRGAVGAHRWARKWVPGYEPATRRLAKVPRGVLRGDFQTRQSRAAQEGDRLMNSRMEQGNIQLGMGQRGPAANPESLATELDRRHAMGVPALPGDLTEPLRNTTSWASRGVGPGQSLVRERLAARKADEALRVRSHITEIMGEVDDPYLQMEQHSRRAREQAAPLYKKAHAQPMVITPEIASIMRTPAFRDAVPQAHRNILNAERNPEALGLRMREDGTIDPEAFRGLSTEGFDQVIRAMRDGADAAAGVNPRTGRPAHNTNSVHINARANDLRDRLAEQNPDYGDAIRTYGDEMSQRSALESGLDMAKLSGHKIAERARAMPESAHPSWALGSRTALADEASKFGAERPTGNTAAHIRGMLGDSVKQEQIGRMNGNDGSVRQLRERLEAEHQGNILYREVEGSSRSSHNQALDADMGEAVGNGAFGGFNARQIALNAAGRVLGKAGSEFRNEVKDRVAQIATAPTPEDFRARMGEIAQTAARDERWAGYQHLGANLAAKAYAAKIIPETEEGLVLVDVGERPDGSAYGMYGRREDNYGSDGNPL